MSPAEFTACNSISLPRPDSPAPCACVARRMPRPAAANGRRSARPTARHARPPPPPDLVDADETRAPFGARGPVEIREALAIRGARAVFALHGPKARDARGIRGSLVLLDVRPAATQQ
ncbi:hypothetical protein [Streptomyces rimosus]|uniref:hypothetical protein n=1 Tax=Streptomyces rimosus TaxID=1927 RepID=UPI003CCD96F5